MTLTRNQDQLCEFSISRSTAIRAANRRSDISVYAEHGERGPFLPPPSSVRLLFTAIGQGIRAVWKAEPMGTRLDVWLHGVAREIHMLWFSRIEVSFRINTS